MCCSLRKELEVLFSFCIPKVKVIPKTYMLALICLNMFVFQRWSGREVMLGWPYTMTLGSLSTPWSPVRGRSPPPPPPPQWPGPIPTKSYAWPEMMDTGFCGWNFLMDQNRFTSMNIIFFLNLITYCSLLKVLFSFTWNKSYEGNIFMCDISFHNVNYYVRKQMKNLPIKAMSSWF